MHQSIINLLTDETVSDIHILQTGEVCFRKGGKSGIESVGTKLSPGDLNTTVHDMIRRPADVLFVEREEIDCPVIFQKNRFRCNVALSSGKPFITLRRIASKVPSPDELGLPAEFTDCLMSLKNGLVIFAGATGSGKSTSMASLLEHRMELHDNKERIITIEDPIEYHYNESSMVSQREVGRDTISFLTGLRAAMRQDPDVIQLGEVRDYRTAESCLQAAETGHLVLTTLHAVDLEGVLPRFTGLFIAEEKAAAELKLNSVLRAMIVQSISNHKLNAEFRLFT